METGVPLCNAQMGTQYPFVRCFFGDGAVPFDRPYDEGPRKKGSR